MQPEENEHIYSKWLNGELSPAELKKLEASNELPILEKIVSEVDTWHLPKVKSSYNTFKSKLKEKEQASQRKRLYRFTLRIAASIVLLLAAFAIIYTQFFNTIEYQTLAGQSQQIALPDGSQVTMNGASLLSYQSFNWATNRKVTFEGQAFFEVKQQGDFEVTLPAGKIQVVGTKFDVMARQATVNIKCFEGNVIVDYQGKKEALQQGQGFRSTAQTSYERFDFQAESGQPSWIGNPYTRFSNAPLQEVLDAMSMKYGFAFERVADRHLSLRYTGQFTNTNADQALQMVLDPLGVSYTKSGNIVRLE